VSVKIKLKRLGKIRQPYYRVVVADARTKRGGRAIEEIGLYHPKQNPSFIQVDSDRVQYWLGVGAQPTEAVAAILRVTGDWQKFKGEPAPPPMLVAEAKADKKSLFEAAAKDAGEHKDGATTPKSTKKAAPAKETAPAPAESVAAETPAAEAAAPTETASEAVETPTEAPVEAVEGPAEAPVEAVEAPAEAVTEETVEPAESTEA
jgi:small subunit ribosomal protein S16